MNKFEPMRNISRANTNFPTEIEEVLNHRLNDETLAGNLKYYQILAAEYLKLNVSKGLFLNLHMGFGKTIGSYHIMAEMVKQNPGLKILVIAPKSLIRNFQDSSKKYLDLTGTSVPADKISFVRLSSTIEKQIAENDPDSEIDPFEMDEKAAKVVKLNNLDNYLIFIDEAHLFARRISHGSAIMLKLYDMINISNCRLVMLSGSLVASGPFELAPIINLLSGEKLMPETEDEFEALFQDYETNSIKRKAFFQNRCYGLFSRMKPSYLKEADADMYPAEFEPKIVRIEMDSRQLDLYMGARDAEIKQGKESQAFGTKVSKNVNRFKSSKAGAGASYRVRSRQLSNCIISKEIEKLYATKGYSQQEIIAAISDMPIEDLVVNKLLALKTIIESHPKQKGVIYSQFVAVGGAAVIAAYLSKLGYSEIGPDLALIENKDAIKGMPKFARINGSLTQDEQSALVNKFCHVENDRGEFITFLIIGLEQTMGLDLTSTRYSIMYEPYWTDFIPDQFRYRSVRFGSHMSLPKEDRNTQMYILLSVYPKKFDKSKLDPEADLTTDEYIFKLMSRNRELVNSFRDAIDEVSIECSIVKRFGTDKHPCRTCAPTDVPLYTSGDPKETIPNDILVGNPCNLAKKEAVEVVAIELGGDNPITYYVREGEGNIYGIIAYVKADSGGFIMVKSSNKHVYELLVDAYKKIS